MTGRESHLLEPCHDRPEIHVACKSLSKNNSTLTEASVETRAEP